ncbi:MAG: rRNA maturation RNase YbeY [Bacilli bacterium]|nr:rRNA maturation RNase YbeY [Bacilli bacterium]
MNEVEVFKMVEEEIEEQKDVEEILLYALSYLKIKDAEFSVILVDNEKIRELNKEYRKIDRETDVISFALEDGMEMQVPGRRILGDIYISIPKAREQAKEYGHSFQREICFLSVHGLLHLLGYDHMNVEEEKIMFDLQKEILGSYGISR